MERPTIFNETINKKTSSRNKSTIQYERGTLSQENRVFVENTINDAKFSKFPTGYDGTIIKKEVIDFEKEFPGLTFKPTDFLYDKMMNDAHNIFPRNRELKIRVSTYFDEMIRNNLNNIYHYAPRFFTENFVQKTSVNNTVFEAYQVYIYLLCFISWTDRHRLDTDVREFDNIDKILNWIATRRDPSIDFIIAGPSSNSNITNNDFRAHYRTLIDASNDMSSIIAYNQLSSTQTISSDVYNLLHVIQSLPNVYFKSPDEARKYNINIDSAKDVLVSIDSDNNLIFDCSYVNLGDVTEQNKLARFDNLESVITNNKVQSMINTKKLAELFHNYSRIKILELVFTPDTFISSLDAFSKVFVVFKGVSCSERNVYNTIPTNFLKIGGKFTHTNRGYEFKMDVDAITFKSVLADVKSFEIYLTLDPNHTNQIIPNEYSLSFSKHNVYQHAITTDINYDAKNRGTRKVLIKERKPTNDKRDVEDHSINSKREIINISSLLPTSQSTSQSIIINDKFDTKNNPKNAIPQHEPIQLPNGESITFNNEKQNQTFSAKLYQQLKISDDKKDSVVLSIDKSLEYCSQVLKMTHDLQFIHFIQHVISILSNTRKSWTLDEQLDSITLSLSMSSKLSNESETDLINAINSNFTRYQHKMEIKEAINNCPNYSSMFNIYNGEPNTWNESSLLFVMNFNKLNENRKNELMEHFQNNSLSSDEIAQIHQLSYSTITAIGDITPLLLLIDNDESPTNEQSQQIIRILKYFELPYEKEITGYLNKESLIQSIITETFNENVEQIIFIYNTFIHSQEHNIPYSPDDFILFLNLLNQSSTYSNISTVDYMVSTDIDVNELNKFFNSMTPLISDFVVSNVDYVKSFTTFIEEYNLIGGNYQKYFHNILESLTKNDSTTKISEVNSFFKCFKQIYGKIYNLLIPFTYEDGSEIEYSYKTVNVDTQTGTIDGKYFRVNPINGIAEFEDDYGNPITTPDHNFLIYSEKENDLTLFNLYNKYNEIIKPIKNGSFIYSETLAAIQNLDSEFLDYLNFQNTIRFNNTYNIDSSDMYYVYYDKINSIQFNDMLVSMSADVGEITNETPEPRYKIYLNDEPSDELNVSVLMGIDESKFQESVNYFTSNCDLNIYEKKSMSETVSNWIESKYSIHIDNATFMKLDDEMMKEYHSQVGIETKELYYVVGVISSVNAKNSESGSVLWADAKEGEMISFKARLFDSSISPDQIIPSMVTDTGNSLRNNLWRIEDLLIEPSFNTTFNDLSITDIMNNITIISPNFEVSFDNNLGFSNFQELMNKTANASNDVYTIETSSTRGMNEYAVQYKYNHAYSILEITTTVEKEGTNDKYIESMVILLFLKIMYKYTMTTQQKTILIDDEPITKTFISTFDSDLLRFQIGENIFVDAFHFSKLNKYETINNEHSNMFSTYSIDGIDIKKSYWNRTAYINSLMLCPIYTCVSKNDPMFHKYEPKYTPVKEIVEINGLTDKVVIYSYENGFTRYEDKFEISPSSISRFNEDNEKIYSLIEYIYVNSNQKITCYKEYHDVYTESNQLKTYYITDENHPTYFRISFTVNEDEISNIILYGSSTVFNNNLVDDWVLLGSCPYVISSEQPNYIQFGDSGSIFEIIIDYQPNFQEFPTIKQILLNSISISYVNYETKHYVLDRNEHIVKVASINTIKYSNVPSLMYDESDVLFKLTGCPDTIYKLHPIFKYYEKGIVSPRYVDENKDYVMLVNKYNQNIMTKPVYLRSQYNLNNPSVNTLQDSPNIIYRIGDKLDANKKHLLESVNKSMLMFGNVENEGTIEEVALKSLQIHAIPTASKMLLSIEFS